MASKEKPLTLFNGRAYAILKRSDPRWAQRLAENPRAFESAHAFVAAYSAADAVRLIEEFNGGWPKAAGELRSYWSKGQWGNRMSGVTPERGIWVTFSWNDAPERLV